MNLRLIHLLPIFMTVHATAQESVETRVTPLPDERMPSGFIQTVPLDAIFLEGKSAADALQDVPGLSVRRQSSTGQSAFVQIRGGNPRQLSVSLDGFRVSAPFGAGFDLGTLALPGLDSLTVYKGASGVLFGSGALTGAIDLNARPRSQPRVLAGVFGASFGTYGLSVDAQTPHIQTPQGQTDIRVAAQARHSTGDFRFIDAQGTAHTRQNNGSDRVGTLLTVDHRFDPRRRLRSTTLFDGGLRGVPGPSEFQSLNARATLDEQRLVSTARYDVRDAFQLGPFQTDLRTQVGAQSRLMTYVNPQSLLGATSIHNRSQFDALGATVSAHAFAGALVARLIADSQFSGYHAQESVAPTNAIDTRRAEYAIGASSEYSVGAYNFLAGARLTATSGDRDDLQPLPFVGLKWMLTPALSLSANGARTHRLPDFDELYLNLETLRGNPNLQPETAWNADIGLHYASEKYAIGAAYFENQIQQVILFLPVSSLVVAAQNLDGVQARGLELWGQIEPHSRVTLQGSYTLTSSARDGQSQMPHQPLHQGSLQVGLQPLKPLILSGAAHARSQTNLDNFGNLRAPAWISVDTGLIWNTKSWQVGLYAQNIFDDQRRLDSLQQPLPGRSLSLSFQTSP